MQTRNCACKNYPPPKYPPGPGHFRHSRAEMSFSIPEKLLSLLSAENFFSTSAQTSGWNYGRPNERMVHWKFPGEKLSWQSGEWKVLCRFLWRCRGDSLRGENNCLNSRVSRRKEYANLQIRNISISIFFERSTFISIKNVKEMRRGTHYMCRRRIVKECDL